MKKILMIVAAVLFLLPAGWFLGTGLVFLPPKTVQIVREPSSYGALLIVENPLINDSDNLQVRLAWPRIPFTPIGIREESYSLTEPQPINIKIEIGATETGKKIFLIVSGQAKVKDWAGFLQRFNPHLYERGDFLLKMIYPQLVNEGNKEGWSRFQILEKEIRDSAEFQFYKYYFTTYPDFLMKASLARDIAREHRFTRPEEVEEFIKTAKPWYWALGPLYFKQVQQEFERYPYLDARVAQLGQGALLASMLDDAEMVLNWQLFSLDSQEKELSQQMPPAELKVMQARLNAIRESLLADKRNVTENQKGLRLFFGSLPGYSSESNVSLWRAAISQALIEDFGLFVDSVDANYYSWLKTAGMKYFNQGDFGYELAIMDLGLRASLLEEDSTRR